MRRSSKYLLAALVFVAIWVVVAAGAALVGTRTEPSPAATPAIPEPLTTNEIVERVSANQTTAPQVVSWLGDGEAPPPPAPAPVTEAAPADAPASPSAATPATGDAQPEVRGIDPVPPPQPTTRDFSEAAAEAAELASERPRPIDPAELGGVIERLKQSKENGILKPEIPAQMTAFETHRVKIVLARQGAAIEMVSDPSVDLANASEVPVRDFVKVELYGGKDFKVEPVIDDQGPQSIRRRDRGEWEFDVTPLSGGAHDLDIIVLLYEAPAFLPIAKFSQKITVEVPFGSRLKLIWSGLGGDWFLNFLFAPFLAAVAAALVAVRVDRSRPKKAGASGGGSPPEIRPG